MSVKDDMMKAVNKKAEIYRIHQENLRSNDPKGLIFDFLKKADEIRQNAVLEVDFTNDINHIINKLVLYLRRIDNCCVDVVWNKDETISTWRDIYPVGVKIIWSEKYLEQNKNKDNELYISIDHLLLEQMGSS